jgi:CHAT domain-containing protein/Flp pilus assembly protein TadD
VERLLRQGNFDSAAKQAVAGEERTRSDPEMFCRFRILRLEALMYAGKAADAKDLLSHAPPTTTREYDVRSLIVRARRAFDTSDWKSASEYTAAAQRLALSSGQPSWQAEADVHRGILLARQGKFGEAETMLHGAFKRASSAGDLFQKASAINNLGMILFVRSRCDAAIPMFQQAEALWREAKADHSLIATRGNLAMCFQRLGDFDKALEIRKETLQLRQPSLLKANGLGEMGTLLLADDVPGAVEHYKQAFAMARQFGADSDAARWASNLTFALTQLGQWERAEQALAEAESLHPEPRSRPFLELNAAAIALGRGRIEDSRNRYLRVSAANANNPAITWAAHSGIANTFMAASDTASAFRHFEAAIGVIEGAWSELNANEYKITFLSSLIEFYQSYVDALMAQGQVEKALQIADRSRARLLSQRLSREVKQASRDYRTVARQSGSVWLSYWLAPRRSFLWVVTPKEVHAFTLPASAEIEKLVRDYRGFIEGSMRDPMVSPSEAGKALYEKLIAPAASLLQKDADIVIVPDGALHQLSFDTLPVYSPTPHYLVNDYAIAIAPSLGVYQATRPAAAGREVLIIGDPVSSGSDFPPLPHAATEIAAVEKRLAPMRSRVFTKDAARPDLWKTVDAAEYSIIHIAAHAEANEKNPLQSAIILSPSPTPRLFAKDMIDTPLRADLVTLSACRSSGAKAYRGEGLVGFAWTFLQAGSQSVVAGLWDVADESTSMLMDRMYQGIARKESPARALRQARIALLQTEYAKPFYWGPFQCYVR